MYSKLQGWTKHELFFKNEMKQQSVTDNIIKNFKTNKKIKVTLYYIQYDWNKKKN